MTEPKNTINGVDADMADQRAREKADQAVLNCYEPERRQSPDARRMWDRIRLREFQAYVGKTPPAHHG